MAGVKDDNRRCDEEEFFSFPIERREETISFRVLFFILIASYISTSIIISILKKIVLPNGSKQGDTTQFCCC